jgi:hypothetical protein
MLCDFVYKVFVEIPHRYKVFYPALYASESENKDANLFNCVQVSFYICMWFMPQAEIVGFVSFPFERLLLSLF